MRKLAALGTLSALSAGLFCGLSANAAHADEAHPLCTYVTTASGAGELSKIGCARGSGDTSTDIATWDSGSLMDPVSFGTIAEFVDYRSMTNFDGDVIGTAYVFDWDPSLVDLNSLRRELREQYSFDSVTLQVDGQLFGEYKEVSHAKH